ncbi:MAG: potassium channel protein [Chloroflexota bacterium]|nr:potassium channel protein [Chloroflexota bacterium]
MESARMDLPRHIPVDFDLARGRIDRTVTPPIRFGPSLRGPHPIARFRLAGALLAVVMTYGVTGYMLIEGWSLADAWFMTITTIATVGYGEVRDLSLAGEIFTSTLIIFGVGTMLYGFGVFAEMLSDGELIEYRRARAMERQVARLHGHFIICGYGRIGTQIATELDRARVPYVVIDYNPEAVARLEREERLYIEADAASEDALLLAGVERARGLISAVDSDERAVYITLAARSLNRNLYILSRAGQPESIRRLELAGADRVVSAYRMAGHQLTELTLRPALVDVMGAIRHGGSDIAVEEFLITARSVAGGKTLADAGLTGSGTARLLALRREDGTLHSNPDPDLRIEQGDLIIALGTADELTETARRLE